MHPFRRLLPLPLVALVASLAIPHRGAIAATDLVFADGIEDERAGGDPPAPTDCSHIEPPRDFVLVGFNTLRSLWGGEPINSRLVRITLGGGEFKAYTFSRADMPADLSVLMGDTANTGGSTPARVRRITFTECVGDFDPVQEGCGRYVGEGVSAYINFGAPIENAAACNLDPTKAYVMNVILDDPPYDADEWCAAWSDSCGFRIGISP